MIWPARSLKENTNIHTNIQEYLNHIELTLLEIRTRLEFAVHIYI